MTNNDQDKLQKEIRAWEKLTSKLEWIDRNLRSQEIRPVAARKTCIRAIHQFWNTVSQVRGVKAADLDRVPVSPYRVDPLTGEPRELKDPVDTIPDHLGIVIAGYESREDRVRRIIQELTAGS